MPTDIAQQLCRQVSEIIQEADRHPTDRIYTHVHDSNSNPTATIQQHCRHQLQVTQISSDYDVATVAYYDVTARFAK